MADFIEPRLLKGFRDFLPAAEIARRSLVERIEASFRLYGFVPIDTPALEYTEILLGKGGGETEKQVYRFRDNGERDVALRYDLTVPFARFVAQHRGELVLPFKRYHIAKVWRGENAQRGRYREFTQCDFDIVGSGGAAADFEILLVMRNTLRDIGAGELRIHLNHRGLFNRFLERLGVQDKSVEILRAVDKIAKIGAEETGRLLAGIAGEAAAAGILEFTARGRDEDFEKVLGRITELAGGENPDSGRLRLLRRFMADTGIAESFVLDPSITRGLDYYTGIVYETFLVEDPSIGSVCSGGRYDNLAGLYSRECIGGVGSSIGLDRLIASLENRGKLQPRTSYAELAVACAEEGEAGRCQALAALFRKRGIPCEVLIAPDGSPGDLTRQFIQAEKKGMRWAVILPGGLAEGGLGGNGLTLRDLRSRQNREGLTPEDVIRALTGA
ncbi:MAG: histidine--tRNA ligase [Spirochaetaceae bacterium]|jgi:histidyl-tRNA synthetase|nr:histidine--tRNA ligase [Spirochaetaceae bacterium]